tara:strand:+ start:39 stop:215 length:177 start_codon:yes stop_codon:yes gene_type:complete
MRLEEKLNLRQKVLSILLKEFGKDSNNSGIYSCADSWCETQVTTNGVVSYYKAYYRRK